MKKDMEKQMKATRKFNNTTNKDIMDDINSGEALPAIEILKR